MKRPKKTKEFQEYVFHLIPNPIKIGYQYIKISEFDFIDGEQGCYRAHESEIRVCEGLRKRELLNTVLHEILHAVVYSYGLKDDFKDDEEEEKIINALGNGLTEALTRNPKLIKFIEQSI